MATTRKRATLTSDVLTSARAGGKRTKFCKTSDGFVLTTQNNVPAAEVGLDRHMQTVDGVPTLLDLSARLVAGYHCFQHVEEACGPIPEPVQRRILFWSFPRFEKDVRRYSAPSTRYAAGCCNSDDADLSEPSSYHEGLRLLEQGCVEDCLQIGFHLSGVVRSPTVIEGERRPFSVSLGFDRCKITCVKCACDQRDVYWCQHAVALAIHRIRQPDKVKLCLPISETLYQMDRNQLQKFVQYLIAEHHTDVLPTAQGLADRILAPNSDINRVCGAPDPTAGPQAELEHRWHMDDSQICALVNSYLSHTSSMEQLYTLFAKVREMLGEADGNGSRLLRLITEQFLTTSWLGSLKTHAPYQPPALSEKCQHLWDQLGALWVCVVMNPGASAAQRDEWEDLLCKWSSMPACAPEIPSTSAYGALHLPPRSGFSTAASSWPRQQRSVLSRASEYCQSTSWDDLHLQRILQNDSAPPLLLHSESQLLFYDHRGFALWDEKLHVSCARVDSLRAHGYLEESLNLAVSIVHTMRHWQRHAAPLNARTLPTPVNGSGVSPSKKSAKSSRSRPTLTDATSASSGVKAQPSAYDEMDQCWLGHPLDPVNTLFDALTDSVVSGHEDGSASSSLKDEMRLLALEAALIALGRQRPLPSCQYIRQKAVRQEEALISKLRKLNSSSNNNLLNVIRDYSVWWLEDELWSGLASADNYPMHTFACYLFQELVATDRELAFRMALRAMKQPIPEEDTSSDDNVLLAFSVPFSHMETQQSHLAACLISSAKEDVCQLRCVMDAVHLMRSSSLVYRLAHDVFRDATAQPDALPSRQNLLNAALELGLLALKMTVQTSPTWSRREMVRWLVTCACTVGTDALLNLLTHWRSYFTAVEAVASVANFVVSEQQVSLQLKLDGRQQEELAQAVHRLALECVEQSPQHCALQALTLCESEPRAFEAAYNVVQGAAQIGYIPPQEIFNIARHVEVKGFTLRAYELALLGLANTQVNYNDDNSPLISDVYWSCALGHSLGKHQLAKVIKLIVRNVKCATVLADILRRCSYTATPTVTAPFGLPAAGPGTVNSQSHMCGKRSKQGGNVLVPTATVAAPPKLSMFDCGDPLRQLLDAAIAAYVNTTHSRLTHISPRHYSEFCDYLLRARETFFIAAEGHLHFAQLIENMKVLYKGKKKLIALITERFG